MTQIKKITDKQGNDIYLRTHTKAVIDDNGYTAESRLQAMQDEINQKQLEVGAIPSDLTPTENSTNWVTSGGIYNAINSKKYSASDTSYIDNHGIGTTNVQSTLDNCLLAMKGNGIIDTPEYGDNTWTWGKYCTLSGSLSASQYWGRKAFSLVAGQTISVSTKGSGAGIITKTNDGVTFTVIESVPNGVTTYNTLTYTPSEEENVTVFLRNNASDTQPVVNVSATVHGADSAKGTFYDNTQSGLASTNVQDAIDEIMDSSNALEVANGGTGTLDISDEDGYVVARFQGGHVKTKNFDSSLALTYEIIKQL